MKQKLKELRFKISEYKAKRTNAFFGTSLYEKISPNLIPQYILVIAVGCFLFLLYQYIHILSDFLFWFVGILEITKVLKIPFLDHLKYYQYLSLFVYFYLSFSLLWDVAGLLSKLNVNVYLIRNEVWIIRKKGIGHSLFKFDCSPDKTQVDWSHSGFLDFFGLNQVVWKKDDHILGKSPYFFPYGKNRSILNQILKR